MGSSNKEWKYVLKFFNSYAFYINVVIDEKSDIKSPLVVF